MALTHVRSFTSKWTERAARLSTMVMVTPADTRAEVLQAPQVDPAQATEVVGVWDTGATSTMISEGLAKSLNLVPVSARSVAHAGGVDQRWSYLVDVWLPNQVVVRGVVATDCAGLTDFDVLIGMDIITAGDFSVTSANGRTVMSFRMPSLKCIDYVEELNQQRTKPSRNQMCPCGSGKKSKLCCFR